MAEMVMPRLSDTMEEGTILRWLKRDGEHVARGEELLEIETDKANMTYESDQEGILRIVAQEGDSLPVGATIAHIGETAASAGAAPDSPTTPAASPPDSPTAPAPDSPIAPAPDSPIASPPDSPTAPAPDSPIAPAAPAPTPAPAPAVDAPPATPPLEGERVKASPVARRVARENHVDLQKLSGTGPGGRIVKADVEAGKDTPETPAPPPSPPPPPVESAKGETTPVDLSRTQRAVARRMAESKATIPDFTLSVEVDMEECVALRTELKRLSQPNTPTYNDMVVKASALALREHGRANGSYRDGRFELHARVNVGVAVATEDALVVPTVFDADTKSLGEIARETRTLAERVRDATITPPELGGGTFTVSNLGMFGVRSFAAIVNPPQAAILSVGALERRAVVRPDPDSDDEPRIVARHTLSLTLACDHRILYGADAARFAARIRELLEAPASLTL